MASIPPHHSPCMIANDSSPRSRSGHFIRQSRMEGWSKVLFIERSLLLHGSVVVGYIQGEFQTSKNTIALC